MRLIELRLTSCCFSRYSSKDTVDTPCSFISAPHCAVSSTVFRPAVAASSTLPQKEQQTRKSVVARAPGSACTPAERHSAQRYTIVGRSARSAS